MEEKGGNCLAYCNMKDTFTDPTKLNHLVSVSRVLGIGYVIVCFVCFFRSQSPGIQGAVLTGRTVLSRGW